jgi:hypothetical protein
LVESAVWEASLFEEHDFHDFKISVKHNDPVVMVKAYEMLSERGAYLSHEGDEAGIALALEKIWLDWRNRRLIQPIWRPIGVDQAVSAILNQVTIR